MVPARRLRGRQRSAAHAAERAFHRRGFPVRSLRQESTVLGRKRLGAARSRSGSSPYASIPVVSVSADGECAVDSRGRLGCAGCSSCRPETLVRWVNGDFTQTASLGEELERLACALTRAGHVACFRPSPDGRKLLRVESAKVAALSDIAKLSASADAHLGCALTHAGAVSCWGDHWRVRAEEPATSIAAVEDADCVVRLARLPRATDLAVSGVSACATTVGGQVYCWGSNILGGAPNGAFRSHGDPVPVRWPPRP